MTDNLPKTAVSAVPLSLREAMTNDTEMTIQEMKASLHVAKGVIKVLGSIVDNMNSDPEALAHINPLKLKQIIETNFTALATIRKLRYLDVDDQSTHEANTIDSVLKRIHSKTLNDTLERIPTPNITSHVTRQTTTTKTRVTMGDMKEIKGSLVIDHETHGRPSKRAQRND